MLDRKDEIGLLEGDVSETSTSDAAVSRNLAQLRSEYYATGRTITANAAPAASVPSSSVQILEPGHFSQHKNSFASQVSGPTSGVVRLDQFSQNPSVVARNMVIARQEKKSS